LTDDERRGTYSPDPKPATAHGLAEMARPAYYGDLRAHNRRWLEEAVRAAETSLPAAKGRA
jgi:D-tyrosyl-tRNA(Tyr) deacylase